MRGVKGRINKPDIWRSENICVCVCVLGVNGDTG